MNRPAIHYLAPLAALLLGALALASTLAAMPEPTISDPQRPALATESMTPDQAQEDCIRWDRNHDGYVSLDEFKVSHKPATVFMEADMNHDSRLDLKECESALRRS